MAYSVWSHGRSLGTSELSDPTEFVRWRSGFFVPSQSCGELMPVLTGVRRCASALARAALSLPVDAALLGRSHLRGIEPRLRETKEYDDLQRARGDLAALALELRGANGRVIATDAIEIVDALSVAPEVFGSAGRLYQSAATPSSDEFPLYYLVVSLSHPRKRVSGEKCQDRGSNPDVLADTRF